MSYSVSLSGSGEGYYSIFTEFLDNNTGSQVAKCAFDCGGAGSTSLQATGVIDWTQGSPQDFIGEEMSIWCGEAGSSLWVKFYSGVAPNNTLVGEGRLDAGSFHLGTQGGTGVFKSPDAP